MEEKAVSLSPGRQFVEACLVSGTETVVEYDVSITDSLTSSRRKPRYPARNAFKVVDLARNPQEYYWHESPPGEGDTDVELARTRREAASRFHKSPVPELLPTTAWVQVPEDLWKDPAAFESFVNLRLIVRLCTAENDTILLGEHGLLNMPGIARMTAHGPFGSAVLAACNEVEQMGGTADGLLVNPLDYYVAMSRGTLMDDLERNGMFVVRTRLVEPGTAVVGDFGHGAQLFDSGRSVIRFAEPPEGTFGRPGIALMARIWERVVVNLPTNFFLVSL